MATVSARLHGRSFLTLVDFYPAEIVHLLDLAAELKEARREGREEQRLAGKRLALIFEQDSIRARCMSEVAAYDQGAHVTLIGPDALRLGRSETVKDTARMLGRIYDAIDYRGGVEGAGEELARWAGVPIYSGPTGEWHPVQALADLLTVREHARKPLDEVACCYLGDARSAMAAWYLVGGSKLGMDVRVAAPPSHRPDDRVVHHAGEIAARTGGRLTITDDVGEAVQGCDVVVTGPWVSLREPDDAWAERIRMLLPFQVNAETMAMTGNRDARFLHCLPAIHSPDSAVGKRIAGRYGLPALEVTDDVFESPASLVFDAAENRLHAVKAVMVATIAS
jgi:ornithine carbamoyltransferase